MAETGEETVVWGASNDSTTASTRETSVQLSSGDNDAIHSSKALSNTQQHGSNTNVACLGTPVLSATSGEQNGDEVVLPAAPSDPVSVDTVNLEPPPPPIQPRAAEDLPLILCSLSIDSLHCIASFLAPVDWSNFGQANHATNRVCNQIFRRVRMHGFRCATEVVSAWVSFHERTC